MPGQADGVGPYTYEMTPKDMSSSDTSLGAKMNGNALPAALR